MKNSCLFQQDASASTIGSTKTLFTSYKALVTLLLLFITLGAWSQVVFEIKSPASVKGFYTMQNADSTTHFWGNSSTANKSVQAKLQLATGADSVVKNALGAEFQGKIAVVFRGGQVSFADKALRAQDAGAVAVIIVNHGIQSTGPVNGDEIFAMAGGTSYTDGSSGSKVKIPVVMISKNTYLTLSPVLRSGETVLGYIGGKYVQTIPSYISKDGLVGWWPFNGNANDGSGNGNHGRFYAFNGTNYQPNTDSTSVFDYDRDGNQNAALKTKKYAANVQLPITNELYKKDFTISIWSKVDSLTSEYPSIIESENNRFTIQYSNFNNNSKITSYLGEPSKVIGEVSASINPKEWNQITLVNEKLINKLYINGKLVSVAKDTNSNQGQSVSSFMRVGNGIQLPQCTFYGSVDDIAIYNRALTTEEISKLQSSCVTVSPKGDSMQYFCGNSLVSDLKVVGSDVKWYTSATGGSVLANTDKLTDGSIYYASQTMDNCESKDRFPVKVISNFTANIQVSSDTICSGTSATLSVTANQATTGGKAHLDSLLTSGNWSLKTTYNGHSYLQYKERKNWADAKKLCEDNGGYLMCINSKSENDSVAVKIANSQDYGDFYIGLYQDDKDSLYSEPAGGWKWLDGTPLTYSNWAKNEPSGGGESHGMIDWSNMGEYWNDVEGYISGTVIMEYPGGNTTYLWSTGEKTATIQVSPTKTSEYWVDVTNEGVTCRKYIKITVQQIPSAKISYKGFTYLPKGGELNLTASATSLPTNYIWYKDGSPIVGENKNSFLVRETGGYNVKISNGFCSTTSELVKVKVATDSLPKLVYTGNPKLCTGDSLILQVNSSDSIMWIKDGMFISTSSSKLFIVYEPGSYYARVQENNCFYETNRVQIVKTDIPMVDILSVFNNSKQELPNYLFKNQGDIQLFGYPEGGVFSGEGLTNSVLKVTNLKLGKKTIKYTYKSPEGCLGEATKTTYLVDSLGSDCNTTKYDTVTVKMNVYDTVKVNTYDTITITKNITKYDTVTIKNNIYDTVIVPKTVTKYDTITVTNNVTKYDTVKINKTIFDTVIVTNNVTKYDTVKVTKFDTLTIKNNVYDTVTITNNITKYDTVKVTKYDTLTIKNNIYDTVTITNNVTKYDTLKVTKFDTITVKNNVFDTVTITNNVTKYDTVKVTKIDTITIKNNVYDTVTITNNVTKYDTITLTDTVSILKITFKLTTGIQANQMASMSVYPNPTTDVLHIEVPDAKALEGYRYRILDALGKEVYNELVKSAITEIPLKTLGAAGMYQFEVLDQKNVRIQANKIVLQ